MATTITPNITLNNGPTIPQIGFGTLSIPPDRNASPENTAKTAEVVSVALKLGYRHIDTAQMYGNERGVGQGVASPGIPREQLYVTSNDRPGRCARRRLHRPLNTHIGPSNGRVAGSKRDFADSEARAVGS